MLFLLFLLSKKKRNNSLKYLTKIAYCVTSEQLTWTQNKISIYKYSIYNSNLLFVVSLLAILACYSLDQNYTWKSNYNVIELNSIPESNADASLKYKCYLQSYLV